jgi:hypothetical protein
MVVPSSTTTATPVELAARPAPEERRPRQRDREERDEWDDEPPRREVATRTSGKAIGAIVLGVFSFCFSLLAGVPAVILGIMSLSDISSSHGRVGGRGLAITGIVLGVIGSLLIGPAILLGLLLFPAVQKVREAAEQAQSTNNLRQLSLAMLNYADTNNGRLPPSVVFGADGKPLYSWRVLILPYVEADNLYHQFRLDEPWDSPNNKPLLKSMPRCFAEPVELETGMTHYQVFDGSGAPFDSSARPLQPFMLAGPQGMLQLQASAFQVRFPVGFTDGTSNTLLIVEATETVPWTSPKDLDFGPGKPLPRLGLPSRKGFKAAYADVNVKFIPSSTSEQTLRALITPNAGDIPGPDAP